MTIILPTTCEYAFSSMPSAQLPLTFLVSQIIALEIRRPNSARPYLFPQLFVGISYVCAALIMLELRRVKRKEH